MGIITLIVIIVSAIVGVILYFTVFRDDTIVGNDNDNDDVNNDDTIVGNDNDNDDVNDDDTIVCNDNYNLPTTNIELVSRLFGSEGLDSNGEPKTVTYGQGVYGEGVGRNERSIFDAIINPELSSANEEISKEFINKLKLNSEQLEEVRNNLFKTPLSFNIIKEINHYLSKPDFTTIYTSLEFKFLGDDKIEFTVYGQKYISTLNNGKLDPVIIDDFKISTQFADSLNKVYSTMSNVNTPELEYERVYFKM